MRSRKNCTVVASTNSSGTRVEGLHAVKEELLLSTRTKPHIDDAFARGSTNSNRHQNSHSLQKWRRGAAAISLDMSEAEVKPRPLKRSSSADKLEARSVGAKGRRELSKGDISRTVHAVILAGGADACNPLTRRRAKPAIPIGGSYRLVDVPISNCLNSGINKIFVLTQFNSSSLNNHVTSAYQQPLLSAAGDVGWVDVLSATQTPTNKDWMTGSADAVRRHLNVVAESVDPSRVPSLCVVLSGEALYRMDYGQLIAAHRANNADITIAASGFTKEEAKNKGLMRVVDSGRLVEFEEKPAEEDMNKFCMSNKWSSLQKPYVGSLGIYVFSRDVLLELLQNPEVVSGTNLDLDKHFGQDVVPHAMRSNYKVHAEYFDGYWQDVGTLKNYYHASIALAKEECPFSLFDTDRPMFTLGRTWPPSRYEDCTIENTIVADGCVLKKSTIKNSVVGLCSYIGSGCTIEDSLLLGNDFYGNPGDEESMLYGVESGCTIKGAILDRNSLIGKGSVITNAEGIQEANRASLGYTICDGIVTVLKGATIPEGTRI